MLRGEGREIKEEKHQCERETEQSPLVHIPTRYRTCNLGMCPDWELKPTTFQLMGRHSNQLSYPGKGYREVFKSLMSRSCPRQSKSDSLGVEPGIRSTIQLSLGISAIAPIVCLLPHLGGLNQAQKACPEFKHLFAQGLWAGLQAGPHRPYFV